MKYPQELGKPSQGGGEMTKAKYMGAPPMSSPCLLTEGEIARAIKESRKDENRTYARYRAVCKAQRDKLDAEWQERLKQEILGNGVAQIGAIERAVKQEKRGIILELERLNIISKVYGAKTVLFGLALSHKDWQALKGTTDEG